MHLANAGARHPSKLKGQLTRQTLESIKINCANIPKIIDMCKTEGITFDPHSTSSNPCECMFSLQRRVMRNGKFSDADFQQNLSIVSNIDFFCIRNILALYIEQLGTICPHKKLYFNLHSTYNLHMAFCAGLQNRKGLMSPTSY
jgi:hypothetical protein